MTARTQKRRAGILSLPAAVDAEASTVTVPLDDGGKDRSEVILSIAKSAGVGIVGVLVGVVSLVVVTVGSFETAELAGGTLWAPNGPMIVSPQWTIVAAITTGASLAGLLSVSIKVPNPRAFWAGFALVTVVGTLVSFLQLGHGVLPTHDDLPNWILTEVVRSPLTALLLIIGVFKAFSRQTLSS